MMGAADKSSSHETMTKSIRVVKMAKKLLRKQDDRSLKTDLLANTVIEQLKLDISSFDEVKKWIEQDETFETSADGKSVCMPLGKKRKREDKVNDGSHNTNNKKSEYEKVKPVDPRVYELETAYREALAAFKADKTNKDLRRAKSAARKAWDLAVAETQDGVQLTCKDCSQSFMFTEGEREFYNDLSFDSTPTKCQTCNQLSKLRCKERRDLDSKNIKGKNMCWAFQHGKCTHGDKCKFSHNPDFGGKPKEVN